MNGVSIHERSKNIDNRKSVGHWEGNLVSDSKNTYIATLVDRNSRFTIIPKLAGNDVNSVHTARKILLKPLYRVPLETYKSRNRLFSLYSEKKHYSILVKHPNIST